MNIKQFQDDLILKIENSAEWRSQKAVEYPDDERNQASADALTKLAAALSALPENHPGLVALWAQENRPAALALTLGSSDEFGPEMIAVESEFIGRYGFDGPEDGDADAFLRDLHDAIDEEMR
jgi:hypothetical protein